MNQNATIDSSNKEFRFAEQLVLYSHRSIYLTGKAGTGKSTFLRYIKQNTTKNVVVVAPTGIAAINVGGMTINSFLQLPFTPFVWDLFSESQRNGFYNFSKEKREIIQKADLIIIDEISMVRADVIDAIDFRLRHFGGKKNLPFGGKQILFVGDTFQLEPIVQRDEWQILNKYYESPYFFSARVFKETNLINIELQKVYRQSDPAFVNLLNKVRIKQAQPLDLQELNKTVSTGFQTNDNDGYITLATKRDIVDSTNLKRLEALEGQLFQYEGILEGTFGRNDLRNDDLLPTNRILDLKEGAQVMFVKNDRGGRWVNGTIGKIESLSDKQITVSIQQNDDKLSYTVDKAIWENIRYELNKETGKIEEKVIGTFTQYPIKLAWAITIHKSQGLTFDKIVIDMGDGAFAAGHTYVALSRCTSLEGIKLRRPLKLSDIIVRDEVIKMAQTANNENLINTELTDSRANHYYRESIQLFNQGRFTDSYNSFLKAREYRDDSSTELFKRMLSLKLQHLKSNNPLQQNIDLQEEKFQNALKQHEDQIKQKDVTLAEKDALLEKSKKEIEELYQDIDIKERAERNAALKLQQAETKISQLQKDTEDFKNQIEKQKKDKDLENQLVQQTEMDIQNLSNENILLKHKLSILKQYTLYAAIFVLILIVTAMLILK